MTPWQTISGYNYYHAEFKFTRPPFRLFTYFPDVVYWVIVIGWLIKEVFFSITNKYVNVPKNGVIIGTLLSWYYGIVYFDGDLTFTLLNLLVTASHIWRWFGCMVTKDISVLERVPNK